MVRVSLGSSGYFQGSPRNPGSLQCSSLMCATTEDGSGHGSLLNFFLRLLGAFPFPTTLLRAVRTLTLSLSLHCAGDLWNPRQLIHITGFLQDRWHVGRSSLLIPIHPELLKPEYWWFVLLIYLPLHQPPDTGCWTCEIVTTPAGKWACRHVSPTFVYWMIFS